MLHCGSKRRLHCIKVIVAPEDQPAIVEWSDREIEA